MSAAKLTDEYMVLLKRFPLVPILDSRHLDKALQIIDELVNPVRLKKLTSEEKAYLDVLSVLVSRYEDAHVRSQLEKTEPRELLQYLIERNELTLEQLADEIDGYKSNLSAFLSGKRGLSKILAIKLGRRFAISPELFLPA